MTRIASIGWGSLIWSPRELPLLSCWFTDGPNLPVEFTRQATDGRITLVIDKTAKPVRTLWALLDVETISHAHEALRRRENVPEQRPHHIGSWQVGADAPSPLPGLEAWMRERDLSGVVWTALPSQFAGIPRSPTADEIVSYLKGLTGQTRQRAEEYIRRAPAQTDTAYRRRIEAELGWKRQDLG